MARIRSTARDPNYRSGSLDEQPPEVPASGGEVEHGEVEQRGSPGGAPSTPGDSILIEESAPLQETREQAMLRVEGLKRAYTRKSEEAEKTKALQQQIDQLKNQVDQLQASLDDANKKLEEQTEPLQRLSKAETENGRLAKENEHLRKEAAAANENFKATLESEQERLIEENEHDCANRMQRAFSLIHPEADFT
ncbi:tropomyosin-2-like, partial [Chenopodium quinoa]|uniref:tropomyosin-2-like n=1 Tax=Chenopodium quinoa TaxID=63459 RepID=UPI000B77A8AA